MVEALAELLADGNLNVPPDAPKAVVTNVLTDVLIAVLTAVLNNVLADVPSTRVVGEFVDGLDGLDGEPAELGVEPADVAIVVPVDAMVCVSRFELADEVVSALVTGEPVVYSK